MFFTRVGSNSMISYFGFDSVSKCECPEVFEFIEENNKNNKHIKFMTNGYFSYVRPKVDPINEVITYNLGNSPYDD
jgi:hypothetical protein